MNCDSIGMFDFLWDSFVTKWGDENGYVAFYSYMYDY